MTNEQIFDIYKANLPTSVVAALRGVWNAGYYAGAVITPSAGAEDKSQSAAKPVAVLTIKNGKGK